MESGIYSGTLRHRRFEPVLHEFRYGIFMAFLDIDRIPELMSVSPFSSYNRFNWAAFAERDHLRDQSGDQSGDSSQTLRERLHVDARAQGIVLDDGPVFLLTHLRYLGYNFNPISLFYCYDHAGQLRNILAEVNSTFGETHNYWLTPANRTGRQHRYRCAKKMHVSPFMGMDLDYTFALSSPGETLALQMETLDGENGFFDATLSLRRQPWCAPALHRALIAHPWMTAKVIAAIHWQALRLYLKKAPVYTYVPHRQDSLSARTSQPAHRITGTDIGQ